MIIKKPKIVCVIVNWNNWKLTVDCLQSLLKANQERLSLTITIVDNGSTDNSTDKLSELQKTCNFVLLKSDKNTGFTGGNNIGIKSALKGKADFVFLLNNDALIDRNCLDQLLIASSKHKDVDIFTPKIYFAEGYEFHKRYKKEQLGKVIWSAGGLIDWKNVYASNYGVDEVDGVKFEKPYDTDFATGAAMFIRCKLFEEIGVFDDRYYLYFEDVDLCERYKRLMRKIVFIPKAKVWHKVAQSSGIGSDLNDYFITRNRLLFGMGYAPIRTKIALYRESVKFLMYGRKWQKKGVFDFYTANFGKGSWK